MTECCGNCSYFTLLKKDYGMYCTKKNTHTFHLNICAKWKKRD